MLMILAQSVKARTILEIGTLVDTAQFGSREGCQQMVSWSLWSMSKNMLILQG